jgi:hypothetical protein
MEHRCVVVPEPEPQPEPVCCKRPAQRASNPLDHQEAQHRSLVRLPGNFKERF